MATSYVDTLNNRRITHFKIFFYFFFTSLKKIQRGTRRYSSQSSERCPEVQSFWNLLQFSWWNKRKTNLWFFSFSQFWLTDADRLDLLSVKSLNTVTDAGTLFVMFLVNWNIFLHIIRGSEDHGDSLVDGGRLDVQDVHGSSGGQASCLLHDEGHGVAFIQQPQLQGKIQKDDQWVMKMQHEGKSKSSKTLSLKTSVSGSH